MNLMSKVERGRTAKPPRIFVWIGKSTFRVHRREADFRSNRRRPR